MLEDIPITGTRTDILLRCEFSRIFLLLILRPTAQRLALPLAKLLEKYMWGSSTDPVTRGRFRLLLFYRSMINLIYYIDFVTDLYLTPLV